MDDMDSKDLAAVEEIQNLADSMEAID